MSDIVPDFIQDSEDLAALGRYLGRMGVSAERQVQHVLEAFEPLAEYMECVFRPRHIKYTPNYWPSKPKATPFAPLPPLPSKMEEPRSAPGEQDDEDDEELEEQTPLSQQARRVLRLAPVALSGLERLIQEDAGRRKHNGPAQPLLWEEYDALHRLHRELGELLRMARTGRPLEAQFEVVRKLVGATFKLVTDTGELIVAGIPPLAASALPAFGSLKACETLLGLDATASAQIAAGVIAGSYAVRPLSERLSGGKKPGEKKRERRATSRERGPAGNGTSND